MSFFKELKRRNVFKVAAAYIVLAWVVMQVADVILNNMDVPGWVFRVILLLLGIGFPLAIFFAWAFELTPEGLRREHDVKRPVPDADELSVEEPPTEPEKSIAVLPFPDMSAERDQEHFCDGLTEELLNVFTVCSRRGLLTRSIRQWLRMLRPRYVRHLTSNCDSKSPDSLLHRTSA